LASDDITVKIVVPTRGSLLVGAGPVIADVSVMRGIIAVG